MDGALDIPPRYRGALRAAGLETISDVLGRATLVRDLPDRQNLRLEAGGIVVHVKRRKAPARGGSEAEGLALARAAGVPTPELAFSGRDRVLGQVSGTVDLAPAVPLDAALRRGMDRAARGSAVRALARHVARLHDACLHHKDLYLNHVYVDPSHGDDPVRGIVDWERLGRHRRALSRWVVKDLAALYASIPAGAVDAGLPRRFLLGYLRARGLDARRLGARLHRRVAARAARMRRHVPRTPVGDAARPGETAP